MIARLRRLLVAGAERPRDALATLATLGIVACATWSGLIHLGLGSPLFTLNGVGFLGNAVVVAATLVVPRLRYRVRFAAAAWLALYAVLTIAGWRLSGAPLFPEAIAALAAETGIIALSITLFLAYRRAAQRYGERLHEPGPHPLPPPSVAPFATAALSGVLLFFLAANPWAEIGRPPATPPASVDPGAPYLSAERVAFGQAELVVPAGRAFSLRFENREAVPHNVAIHDGAPGAVGGSRYVGAIFAGPAETVYEVPALAAGDYVFLCTVHPSMVGVLHAEPAP